MQLSFEEGRVIGSLIEKQLTTPQQYPLSLNALVLACNQSSNRDPVVAYDERLVDAALVSLKNLGVLRFVHPSHGRSVTRYRQVLEEQLALSDRQLSLLAVLLLRGAQTAGEMRTRTERMADFAGIAEVDAELEGLSARTEPLARRLQRQPGQKEERWIQLLAGTASEPEFSAETTGHDAPGGIHPPAAAVPTDIAGMDLASVAAEVSVLREEVAALRDDVDRLRSDLYG